MYTQIWFLDLWFSTDGWLIELFSWHFSKTRTKTSDPRSVSVWDFQIRRPKCMLAIAVRKFQLEFWRFPEFNKQKNFKKKKYSFHFTVYKFWASWGRNILVLKYTPSCGWGRDHSLFSNWARWQTSPAIPPTHPPHLQKLAARISILSEEPLEAVTYTYAIVHSNLLSVVFLLLPSTWTIKYRPDLWNGPFVFCGYSFLRS